MQKLSKQYLAGFFDGEGSISLTNQPARKRQGNSWPVLQCALGQIDSRVIRQVKACYGGWMGIDRSSKRGCWKYGIAAAKAEKLLRDLVPFLIGKQAEAIAALCYRDTFDKGNERLTSQQRRNRKQALARFHKIRKSTRAACAS